MTKHKPEPPKRGTYFEQIPVEVVKKVAVPDISQEPKPKRGTVIREPAARKTEPYSVSAHRLAVV